MANTREGERQSAANVIAVAADGKDSDSDSTTARTVSGASGDPPSFWRSPKEHWQKRWEASALRTYIKDTGKVRSKDVDIAVGSFAVVNTLILTIPITIQGALNHEHYEFLEQAMVSCGMDPVTASTSVASYVMFMQRCMIGAIYSSATSILISVIYYMFRPAWSRTLFSSWWKRGRFVVLFLIIGTLAGGILVMMLAGYTALYGAPASILCEEDLAGRNAGFWMNFWGVFFALLTIVVSLLLVF